MSSETIDWETLRRLRAEFLDASGATGVYWNSQSDLELYHRFFGARIGWKWDAALAQAAHAGWRCRSRKLFDWGCGSGIAALSAIRAIGADAIDEVALWDHSTLATRFARETLQREYPDLNVTIAERPDSGSLQGYLCLASHVLNEMTAADRDGLSELFSTASQVFWVEPGSYDSSRALLDQREALLEAFNPVAPCVCDLPCPMHQEENARHWCHFFGRPPVVAFTDRAWAQFGKMMEIDLRSLPYSFLALDSRALPPAPALEGVSRVLGRPRQYKGYTRVYSCDSNGHNDYELQKRDDKALWKAIKKERCEPLYKWTRIEEGRILSGEPANPVEETPSA